MPHILFQFQTGAIKRDVSVVFQMGVGVSFNSKLVRLKEDSLLPIQSVPYASFNSKLVRLKVNVSSVGFSNAGIFKCFNSKLVRLKAEETLRAVITLARFNSKLVRLKALPPRKATYLTR